MPEEYISNPVLSVVACPKAKKKIPLSRCRDCPHSLGYQNLRSPNSRVLCNYGCSGKITPAYAFLFPGARFDPLRISEEASPLFREPIHFAKTLGTFCSLGRGKYSFFPTGQTLLLGTLHLIPPIRENLNNLDFLFGVQAGLRKRVIIEVALTLDNYYDFSSRSAALREWEEHTSPTDKKKAFAWVANFSQQEVTPRPDFFTVFRYRSGLLARDSSGEIEVARNLPDI